MSGDGGNGHADAYALARDVAAVATDVVRLELRVDEEAQMNKRLFAETTDREIRLSALVAEGHREKRALTTEVNDFKGVTGRRFDRMERLLELLCRERGIPVPA